MVSCFRKIKISLQKKIFIRYSLRRISYHEHGKNSAEKSSKSAKMCKLYESTFLRTRQTEIIGKMCKTETHQENANQNHNEILYHPYLVGVVIITK